MPRIWAPPPPIAPVRELIRSLLDDLPAFIHFSASRSLAPRDLPITAKLRLIEPCNDNRKVLRRGTNAELRSREYLTPAEIEKLIKAAKDGGCGMRR